MRAEGLSTYVIEETAKALKNTKTIEAKFAEQISNKLIKKVQVEITSFEDLRINWIGPLRNLVAEINSRKSWSSSSEIWQKENTFKIQLSNTERKMRDMLEYHKQADSEVILLFLDVQVKFHKEAYLSYKEYKEKIVQNRGEELHKSRSSINKSEENLNRSKTSEVFRKYQPHPPNQAFEHKTFPRPKSQAFSTNSEFYSARSSLASNSNKRMSKAEDQSFQLGQRISDQAKIHKQAEQTDSGAIENVYKLKSDIKPQMGGLKRTSTNYNMKHHITGPIKPIHFNPETSGNEENQNSRLLKRTNTSTNGKYCRSLFSYNGRNQNELSFERGEVIEILSSNETKLTHFGRTVKDSRFGSFPINVVELI